MNLNLFFLLTDDQYFTLKIIYLLSIDYMCKPQRLWNKGREGAYRQLMGQAGSGRQTLMLMK